MLNPKTLDQIEDEVLRSWSKHGDNAMINPALPVMDRLAILGEEFGEVCKALTYDNKDPKELRKELIQLATMAACWADVLPEED
jgi:hypothetical protein